MVDYCANPRCMKPLHYLREGTIYIFEVPDVESDDPNGHRLEHYWLCGDCAATHLLERTANCEVRLAPKGSLRFVRRRRPVASADRALAS
jgi:hypothetical protein